MSAIVSDNESDTQEEITLTRRIERLEISIIGSTRNGENNERVSYLEIIIEGFHRDWLDLPKQIAWLENDI